jgi:hypothetical protein
LSLIASDLEEALETLPEVVAQCLLNWRKATLDREKTEASLYLQFKGLDAGKTATEIKAMIHESKERYEAVLSEISCESVYTAKYETLLAMKHKARLREAF